MPLGEVVFLAFGLAMDAAAVSLARGCTATDLRGRHVGLVALYFGGFQALMPLLGYVVGQQLGPRVQSVSHWLAFIMIGGIGAKMLWEGLRSGPDEDTPLDAAFSARTLLLLAVATSIDALAAGITLPLLRAPFVLSVITIGLVTAALSAAALWLGHCFSAWLRERRAGHRLDALGGLILLSLALKVLADGLQR